MEIRELDGKLVCTLTGHFDTLQSQKLEELLKARLSPQQAVVFEMKDVTYVCSAFLRVCVYAAKTSGAQKFTLLDLAPPIKRVFKMAGLTSFFEVD
jgi:anti-anti-sigma factor